MQALISQRGCGRLFHRSSVQCAANQPLTLAKHEDGVKTITLNNPKKRYEATLVMSRNMRLVHTCISHHLWSYVTAAVGAVCCCPKAARVGGMGWCN